MVEQDAGRSDSGPRKRGEGGGSPRGPSRGTVIAAAVVVAFMIGFVALAVLDSRQRGGGGSPQGVDEFEIASRDHVEQNVNYGQDPPAGGDHSAVWQNSGFYEEPVRNENAVHTLEHGAVWITYSPDLPQQQKDRIRGVVEGQTCMLASPVDGLRSPVVASAWGRQLSLESAESADLERFVRAYRLGPETPEPGATCTGGTSDGA